VETERADAVPKKAGCYIDRKAVSTQLALHEKTVKEWERGGAFVEVIASGPFGKKRYLADAEGRVLVREEWRREPVTGRDEALPAAGQTVDTELVGEPAGATVTALAAPTPFPDAAREDLHAGFPPEVVAARVRARGLVVSAVIVAISLVIVGLAAVAAYLRKHRLLT
jgi:hypothetical protein